MSSPLDTLWQTLFARSIAARAAVRAQGRRFVHYTRADTAVSIIEKRRVWMRNATVMNDFQEIAYGQDAFFHAWRSEQGERLRSVLEQIDPRLVPEFGTRVDKNFAELRFSTYLTSLSEHDATEDSNGRLSMWRAYGNENGVALVLKNTPFLAESKIVEAYSAPVHYATPADVMGEMGRVASTFGESIELFRAVPFEDFSRLLLQMYRLAVLTTKHPGFHEEREWRIVHSPGFARSNVLEEHFLAVGGVYQRVYMIPLESSPSRGLYGASVPDLIDRIIIGPTRYPVAMYDAFVDLLSKSGVPDPRNRVVVSNIPLRQ